MTRLGINHQSPLIYLIGRDRIHAWAENQSPIPFDILYSWRTA